MHGRRTQCHVLDKSVGGNDVAGWATYGGVTCLWVSWHLYVCLHSCVMCR